MTCLRYHLLLLLPVALLALPSTSSAANPVAISIRHLGRGAAIVFSPDLAGSSNCRFYERLGFRCYQTPQWQAVIDDIRCHNAAASPAERISIVILETHGTNGNGLKLQSSNAAGAPRSYAAVGALQEHLGTAGVRVCILSACNSRRLFRPEIYDQLDPTSDRLFLPATLGILSATPNSMASRDITFLTRAESHLEALSIVSTDQLSEATRTALQLQSDTAFSFAVSDLFIQLVTSDSELNLQVARPTDALAQNLSPNAAASRLLSRFVMFLDASAKGVLEPIPLSELARDE